MDLGGGGVSFDVFLGRAVGCCVALEYSRIVHVPSCRYV